MNQKSLNLLLHVLAANGLVGLGPNVTTTSMVPGKHICLSNWLNAVLFRTHNQHGGQATLEGGDQPSSAKCAGFGLVTSEDLEHG